MDLPDAELMMDKARAAAARVARRYNLGRDLDDLIGAGLAEQVRAYRVNGGPAESNLGGFLYGCAMNGATAWACRRLYRMRREEQLLDAVAAAILGREREPDVDDGPLTSLPQEVVAAINGMTERRRVAVIGRYLEGKSHAEVAASLGINEDAAKNAMKQGLMKLRKLLAA